MSDSDSKSDAESVSGDSEELEESDDDSRYTDSDPNKKIGVIVNVNAGLSEDGLAFNYAEESTVTAVTDNEDMHKGESSAVNVHKDKQPPKEDTDKGETSTHKQPLKKDTKGETSTEKQPPKYPSWSGERLYPPNSRKLSNPSKVWQFGGFVKNKNTGLLLTDKTICGICGKEQRYRNSPTNLSQHLASDHAVIYSDNISSQKEKCLQIEQFFLQKKKPSKYPSNNPKQK